MADFIELEARLDDRGVVEGLRSIDRAQQQTARSTIVLTDAWKQETTATDKAVASALKAKDAITKVGTSSQTAAGQVQKLWTQGQRLAAVFGVSLGAAAMVQFAYSAANAASEIVDLSQQLDVSIDYAQRLQSAATKSGTSIDTFSRSIFTLQNNLAEGSRQTEDALKVLHLTQQQLERMSAQDQIDTVIRRLAAFTDVQTRNRVGADLLGMSYRELAKTIAELPRLIDTASTTSTEAVVRLDQARRNVNAAHEAALKNLIELEDAAIQGAKKLDRLLYGERTKALEASANILPSIPSVTIRGTSGLRPVEMDIERVTGRLREQVKAAEEADKAIERVFENTHAPQFDIKAFFEPMKWRSLEQEIKRTDGTLQNFFDTVKTARVGIETVTTLPNRFDNVFDAIEAFYNEVPKVITDTVKWTDTVDALANQFQRLAIISDGSMSSIVRGIGTGIAAISQMQQAITSLQTATSALSKVGSALSLFTLPLTLGGLFKDSPIVDQAEEMRRQLMAMGKWTDELQTKFGKAILHPGQFPAVVNQLQAVFDQIQALKELPDVLRELQFQADQAGRTGIDAVLAALEHQRQAELQALQKYAATDAAMYAQAVELITRKYTALADRAIQDEADRMASQVSSQVDALTRVSTLLDTIKKHTDTEIASLGQFSSAGAFYQAVVDRIRGRQAQSELSALGRASRIVAPATGAPVFQVDEVTIMSGMNATEIGEAFMEQLRVKGQRIN